MVFCRSIYAGICWDVRCGVQLCSSNSYAKLLSGTSYATKLSFCVCFTFLPYTSRNSKALKLHLRHQLTLYENFS